MQEQGLKVGNLLSSDVCLYGHSHKGARSLHPNLAELSVGCTYSTQMLLQNNFFFGQGQLQKI